MLIALVKPNCCGVGWGGVAVKGEGRKAKFLARGPVVGSVSVCKKIKVDPT